jgi:aminoglycoside phosphotransferase (APT) family kinase protein
MKKIGEGGESEIFEWEPGVILKLYRGSADSTGVRERLTMEAVHSHGGPAAEPLGLVTVDGRPGLLMARVEGTDLLSQLDRAPWRILSVGAILGRVHAEVHETTAPRELQSLRERARRRIGSPLVPAELRARGYAALDRLPDGDTLCHGDFHPANVMHGSTGPAVIDWSASSAGDPAADISQTVMTITTGEPPPGSSPWLRTLQRVGSRILVNRYLTEYRRHRAIDLELVERWMLPLRIARLSDGIEGERQRLLRGVRKD